MMSQQENFSRKRCLAACLIICMILQLICTPFVVPTYAQESVSTIHKTIEISEKEIRASLKRGTDSVVRRYVDKDKLPYDKAQNEEAERLIRETLGDDSIIVRQDDLGDKCAAVVAVKTSGQDAETQEDVIENVFLIGLNGNKDSACRFTLRIITDGGLVVERAYLTGYAAAWSGPGVATSSDAEKEQLASASDAAYAETEIVSEESVSNEGEAETDAPVETTAAQEETDSAAETMKASASDILLSSEEIQETTEETLASGNDASASDVTGWTADPVPFEEQDATTLEGDELSALVKHSGVFAAARRMFNLNADNEARAMADAYGLIVLQTTNNADALAGQKIYFVNMYDEAIASELYTHENAQVSTQAFDRVDAIFLTESDADPNKTSEAAGDGSGDGQDAEAGKTSIMEIYDEGVFRVEIPKADGAEPYTRVTFRVYPQGDEEGGALIGRTYRFTGGDEEQGGSFQYEPITNDCLFYSGRGDASKIASCYWNAHPTANPDTLDGQLLYLDLGILKDKIVDVGTKTAETADTNPASDTDDTAELSSDDGTTGDSTAVPPADNGSRINETVNLWLWYMTDADREEVDAKLKAGDDVDYGAFAHQISMKTLNDTVYRYWIPYESGLDENSELVLLGLNKDSAGKADDTGISLEDVYSFPFIYSMDSGKNMIHVDYLMSDAQQDEQDWAGIWGTYAPKYTEGQARYVLFDNELTLFDTEIYAVIWKHDGDESCAFDQADVDGSGNLVTEQPDGTDQAKLKKWNQSIDDEFLKLTQYHGDSSDDGTDTIDVDASGDAGNAGDTGADTEFEQAIVVKLLATKKDEFSQSWAQVKFALGASADIPAEWGTDLHVRYFAWDGTRAAASTADEANASDESFFSVANADEAEGYADANASADTATLADLQAQLERARNEKATDYDTETGYNDGVYNISQTLILDNGEDYPCYYAAKGHNNLPLHGKWDSVFAVNTLGDESENNPTGSFVYDTTTYYGSANIIDFYSDYELTGHTKEKFLYDEKNKDNQSKRKKNPYSADVENGVESLKGKIAADTDAFWELDAVNGSFVRVGEPINNIIYGNQGYTVNTAISEYYKALEENSDENKTVTVNPLYFGNSALNAFKSYDGSETKFYGMGNNERNIDKNRWDGGWDGVKSGLMAKNLSQNGNLQINKINKTGVYNTPYFSESFARGDNALNTAIGKAYNNVLFPFRKDKNGYWTFDSANPNDAVRMMKDEETGAYFFAQEDKGSKTNRYAVSIKSGGNPKYQFLPFNDPIPSDYKQTGTGNDQNGVAQGRYNGFGYASPKHAEGAASVHNLNNMFSMRLDIPFYLTSDGKVDMPVTDDEGDITGYEEQDIVFRFSGDDDVWIYVDGMLALDLGGIHDYGLCEINFADKTITQRGGLTPVGSVAINDREEIDWENTGNKWTYNVTYAWNGKKGYKTDNNNNQSELKGADLTKIADMVNPALMDLDYSKAHTITVFYMERGLHCSNLKISFNFASENSFTVENEIDTAKIDAARAVRNGVSKQTVTGNLGMAKLFKDASKYLGSFDFSIMNAATDGVPLPVERSQGYLLSGGTKAFNLLNALDSSQYAPYYEKGSDIWYVRESEKDYGKDDADDADQSEAVLAKAAETRSRATLNFRSWGTVDTDATQTEIERRLVNIYPAETDAATGTTTVKDTIKWPEEADGKEGAITERVPKLDENGNFQYDDNGIIYEEGKFKYKSAAYLRFELYSTADTASSYGSALYVGLLDKDGNRVGGWASELTYNDYLNDIQPKAWNTIRISKEKLKKTVTKFQKHNEDGTLATGADGTPLMQTSDSFDWTAIKAIQLCYYDQSELAVRSIEFCATPTSYDARSFQVSNREISDYKSLKKDAGGEGVYDSKLSPAYGAWYNTRSTVNESGNPTNQPVMVDKKGHFSLGNKGFARFTDKFRTGSYLSVRMNDLNERIFTTNWTLQEEEENIPAAVLVSKTSTEVTLSKQLINPTKHAGRRPYDGRTENLKSESEVSAEAEAVLEQTEDSSEQADVMAEDGAQDEQAAVTKAKAENTEQDEAMPFGERLFKKIQAVAMFLSGSTDARAGDDASSIGKIKGSVDLQHPEDDASAASNANTLVYRSFLDPDNTSSGFHTGVKFLTTVDTAGIVLKKLVEKSESGTGTTGKDETYHFIIVYDDIADMGLELNLQNTFAYEGVDLKEDEAKKVDVIAGTRYHIYELKKSVADIEAELRTKNATSTTDASGDAEEERAIKSIADLQPYISDKLIKVEAGAGIKTESGYDVDTSASSAHDYVRVYNGENFARNHSHASGRAYTRMQDGSEGNGLQGFVFTNAPTDDGEHPVEGKGSVKLEKRALDADGNDLGKTLEGAEFVLYNASTGKLHSSTYYITDASGSFTITDLPEGEYYLEESKAPTGYVLDTTHYEFEITAGVGANVSIKAENRQLPNPHGQLTIQKYEAGDESKLLNGAEFSLYRLVEEGTDASTAVSEAFSEKEIAAADNATDGKTRNVTIGGKELTLRLVRSHITTGVGDQEAQDGKYTVHGLPYGTYYLEETKAPDGYELPTGDEVWHKATIGGKTETGEADPEKADVTIKVPNSPRKGKFRVRKEVKALNPNAAATDPAYKKDNFIIRIRQVTDESGETEVKGGLQTDLVLKDGEASEWIKAAVYDGALYFRIEELVPMEYELSGMTYADASGIAGTSALHGDLLKSNGFAVLEVHADAEATVTLKNQEKHTNYFHDTTNVTNMATFGADGADSQWQFIKKQKDGEAQAARRLLWFLPVQDDGQDKKKEKKGRRAEE